MARTQSPAFNPVRLAVLHDVLPEAENANRALLAVLELLHGCAPSHQLSAGGLLLLLEPIAGGLDTLCGDLRMVTGTALIN